MEMQVIKFSAEWCGPCKALAPQFEEVKASRTDVEFFSVDIDKQPKLAASYEVMSIPTILIVKDGETVAESHGFMPAEALEELINKHI